MAFAGHKLLTQDGTLVDAVTAMEGAECVALYFSAHWCPPCRQFTPMLKKFSEEDAIKGKVCIIFVSCDQSEGKMKSYFNTDHGDYYCLPFDDSELKEQLSDNCGVQGIPMLCVVNKEGKCLHKDGRSDLGGAMTPAQVLDSWKKK